MGDPVSTPCSSGGTWPMGMPGGDDKLLAVTDLPLKLHEDCPAQQAAGVHVGLPPRRPMHCWRGADVLHHVESACSHHAVEMQGGLPLPLRPWSAGCWDGLEGSWLLQVL